MSVLLRTSRKLPDPQAYDGWLALGGVEPALDEERRLAGAASRLECAYENALVEWRQLAPVLAHDPGADCAHTPACAPNASDFGEMLAWTRLVDVLAGDCRRTLVVCDDPWLFRHLACRPGVSAGPPPRLAPRVVWLRLRGWLARLAVATQVIAAWAVLRRQRRRFPRGAAVMLVYGHPYSTAEGTDGYFGRLPILLPGLVRMLHVDCGRRRATKLAGSFSLHAWGSLTAALALPFQAWRGAPGGLLVNRARAREAGTGQPAMIRWQITCQREWLSETRPRVVAWPWENHAWERAFVRACREFAVTTVGYQHATVGRHEANYALDCNADGLTSVPDVVVANGPAGHRALRALGYPDDRLRIGGALRYAVPHRVSYDSAAPIFVALPFDARVSREMMDAARRLARRGRCVLVRDHPMTPFAFEPSGNLRQADGAFDQVGALSAVVYAGTSVGLEARLAGLPTFRFMPSGSVPNDIIPPDIDVVAVTAADLEDALSVARPPLPIDPASVFSPPDLDLWRALLQGGRAVEAA